MTILLSIPLYYRSSSYPIHKPHITTTAEYIALPHSNDTYIQDNNKAIAKDAAEWGWLIYDIDVTLPTMHKWWEAYLAKKRVSTWDDDLWRIWQREHAVKLAEKEEKSRENAEKEGHEAQEPTGKMGVVKNGVKKWAKRRSRNATDERLRRHEENMSALRKKGLSEKAQEKAAQGQKAATTTTTMAKGECEVNVSETSLSDSFMEALESMGRLRDHTGDNRDTSNPFVLIKQSWLYRA